MIAAAILFAGIVTSVHDGDTLRIGQTRVRLAGIDANELDGSCHNSCAPMPAIAARDYLAGMVLGRRIDCQPTGKSYRRVVAWCSIGGRDLSCAMVGAGAAVRWARYDRGARLLACERRR